MGDNDRRAHGWFQPDWDYPAPLLAMVVAVTCVAARPLRTWTRPVLAVGLIAAAACGLGRLVPPTSITLSSRKIGE